MLRTEMSFVPNTIKVIYLMIITLLTKTSGHHNNSTCSGYSPVLHICNATFIKGSPIFIDVSRQYSNSRSRCACNLKADKNVEVSINLLLFGDTVNVSYCIDIKSEVLMEPATRCLNNTSWGYKDVIKSKTWWIAFNDTQTYRKDVCIEINSPAESLTLLCSKVENGGNPSQDINPSSKPPNVPEITSRGSEFNPGTTEVDGLEMHVVVPVGLIAGVPVAVIVLIVTGVLVAIFIRHRRHKRNYADSQYAMKETSERITGLDHNPNINKNMKTNTSSPNAIGNLSKLREEEFAVNPVYDGPGPQNDVLSENPLYDGPGPQNDVMSENPLYDGPAPQNNVMADNHIYQ